MKIRIKNNGNKITEALDNPAKQSPQQTPFSYYNATIKKQFMQEQMKENVLVNVVLGEDLPNPIIFQKAPKDLQNLMWAMQTNKAVKTRGFEKWNMDDPISTYNAAEDYSETIFSNFNRTTIASDKTEVSLNNADKASTSESIIFNLNNQLNEDAITTGIAIGNAASTVINSAAGFGAGLALTAGTTIAMHLGVIAAFSTGIGSIAGLNTDATPNGVKRDSESQELNDPHKDLMDNITAQTQNFSNVQTAIKSYVEKILVSLNNYISAVSPSSIQEYRKISRFILQFMHQSTEQANAFVETRLPEIEELEKKQEQKRENRQLRQLAQANEIKDFTALINKMFSAIKNNQTDALKLLEIQQYYESHQKDRSNLFDAAQDGKDALINYYETQIKKQSNNTDGKYSNPLNAAVNVNNFSNKLNEANEELGEGNKPDLNLKPIYDKLSSKLKQEFDGLFDNFDKNKMEGLDDAKEHMKLLIEEADKTIKDRIEKLTKTSQTGGNETGLTKAAVQFLAGHPLEADNLLEIWSRHLADLKQRMSQRLKIMTDVNNTTRTLGWTIAFVKETMPEILARLLTYRYAYQVLSNKGVYSYDTAKARRDSEFYDNNPVIAENYRNSELGILTWILENVTQNYTNDGNSLVVPDEKGGFRLNNNYLAYATLFCNKLGIPLELQQNGETIKTAVILSQLNKNENVNASDDALMTIISNYLNNTNYSIDAINAALSFNNIVAAEQLFNQLYQHLLLNNDEKKEKDLIEKTYNEIKEIISSNPITDDNYKDIFYTFNIILNSNSTDIYNTFINNKDNINELIKKYNEAKKNQNQNAESLNEVKEQIHNIFQYVPFGHVNKDETAWKNIITDIFKEPGQVDYYSYIASFISENNSIEDNCKIAPTLVRLTLSGILSYIDTNDKEEHDVENHADIAKRNLLTVISKARALSNRIILANILEDSNSNVTDNIEKKIKELKEKVESEIKANYTKILEQNKSEYMFNIDNNGDFYKDFYKAIITFRSNVKDQDFKNTISAIGDLPIKLVKQTDSQNKKAKVNDIDNINTKYIILYDFCLAIAETDNNGYSIILKNKLDEIIKLSKKQPKNESYIFYGEKQYKLNSYMLYENIDTIENDQENYTSDNISPDKFSNILDKIEKNNALKKEVENILDINNTNDNADNKQIINNLDNIIQVINNFNL